MHLYLIRHADAVPLHHADAPDTGADAARPLSDLGREQCRALAGAFNHHAIHLARLLTSPLLRARQTSELLRDHLPSPGPDVVDCETLAPGGKKRKLTDFVRDQEGPSIGLVGHNPDLSEFAGWLIGGRAAQIELAKAGVALIEFDGKVNKGSGMLMWMVSPLWFQAPAQP